MSDKDEANSEFLIIGTWQMSKRKSYSRKIEFREEGKTFTQVVSPNQTMVSRFIRFLEGDRYEGDWSITGGKLRLNYTSLPNSLLNLKLGNLQLPIANYMNQFMEVFLNHEYAIKSIDSSKIVFTMPDEYWEKITK